MTLHSGRKSKNLSWYWILISTNVVSTLFHKVYYMLCTVFLFVNFCWRINSFTSAKVVNTAATRFWTPEQPLLSHLCGFKNKFIDALSRIVCSFMLYGLCILTTLEFNTACIVCDKRDMPPIAWRRSDQLVMSNKDCQCNVCH